jgi:hypothetical protein
VQAVRRAGPRKLLFGSDGPWLHPGVELHKIRLLGLKPREEALVLGGNLARLLPARPSRGERRQAAIAPLWPSRRNMQSIVRRAR